MIARILKNIAASLTMLLVFAHAGAAPALAGDWSEFKQAHMAADGRVIDNGSNITHSEGQSYAMLLAVRNLDRTAFDLAWNFTRNNMRRPDGLISWKYQDNAVTDQNNATDGDIVIAWALLEAGRIWGQEYTVEATRLISAIRTRLIASVADPLNPERTLHLLLPGADGFRGQDGNITINLSYWVYPALDAFATIDDPLFWNAVADTGADLTERAAQSSGGLTPDWSSFPKLGPAEGLSYRASYDALRTPLWLIWSGRTSITFQGWRSLWRGQAVAWRDLATGEIAPFAPGPEQTAVLALLDRAASAGDINQMAIPAIGLRTPYFASAITQLARLAWTERFPQ